MQNLRIIKKWLKKLQNFTILSKLTSNHLGGTLEGVLRYNSDGEVKTLFLV